MALPDGTLPFSGGAMMGGDGSPVSRDDIFKLRMTRGGFTTEAYDPLQSPDTEVDINETELFSITSPGIYAEIVQSLASGRIPTITAGTDGRVRRYYYTASDVQAGTMAFANAHDRIVEILTLHSDGTYEIAYGSVSDSMLVATAEIIEGNDSALSQSFSFSESEKIGEDIYIQEGSVKCNAGVYHVDFSISISINQTTPPRPWVETVSIDYGVGYAYINLDRSNMDPTASDSVDVGYDIVVDTDGTTLPVTLIGLGTNCYATMQHFNVHKVAEA